MKNADRRLGHPPKHPMGAPKELRTRWRAFGCSLLVAGLCSWAPARAAAETDEGPTAEQLAALEQLEREAKTYAEDANAYREGLDRIIRHHYEERRRRLNGHLGQAIEIEQERLAEAREAAIERLLEFIARYSGPRAAPQATPDAMYRLAALYEEKGRANLDADLGEALVPATDLYRRIIAEFPNYEQIAGVHYYLGHAYFDSGQLDAAQQAWRSLACANQFTVQTDPNDASAILVQPLAQDRSDDYWAEWYNKNPVPLDRLTAWDKQRAAPGEDREYQNPYAECQALPQKVEHGEEPRYLAEVWWQIGNFHFDQMDAGAGPYAFNRAATAYENSMQYKNPPLYGVALYKGAWTYYKQQRYREAVEGFVELLRYADEQEKETGDQGVDFRSEAYTYIAGSLTYTDFDGPPPNHPFIPRSDIFDEETDPLVAEERLLVAIERVQNPNLIPQDEEWTVDIYQALAQEFIEITQLRNAILTLELTVRKFPLSRDAPLTRARIADLYDELATLAPEGSAVRAEATAKALQARTQLADYVGDSEWTRANQDDPEAIYQAERLVRHGLQRAAAAHTNAARENTTKAEQLSDPIAKQRLLEQAIVEYRSAAKGWAGYIDQDPNAIDAYESQFWRADALFGAVTLQLELGRTPPEEEIAAAREAARRVRDSNEDDKFQQPAAYYVVVLADRVLERRHQEYDHSGGARGVAKLDEVQMIEDGTQSKPMQLPMPPEVVSAADARDEYNAAISVEDDPEKNGPLYEFQAADYYFVYGQFEEAQKRFASIYQKRCGRDEWGYKAWEKLLSMSNLTSNAEQSRKLVDGKSCAFDEQTRAAEDAIRTPVRQGVAYLDARSLYDQAEQLPPGEERDAKWREAAAAYKVALDAAPDRDEAPEAAMNGAFAYKQVGDYDKAIGMYELFVSRYGSDERLVALREGDASADPPEPPQPEKYEARTKYLKLAYDALANAYVLFFDYPKAASTFDAIGRNAHFTPEARQVATEQALKLYASLGDDQAMVRARDQLANQGAAGVDLAQADFVIATSALKEWDQFSPDQGANAAARQRAESAMQKYYAKHQSNPDSQVYVVEAAYWTAKMRRAAKAADEVKWWENTMTAFARMRGNAPTNERGVNAALGTPQASMAAEGAYLLLDDELRKRFDFDAGHHQFRGTPQQVLADFNKAAATAKGYFERLQAVVDEYGSPEWGTAAIARQGSLYDSLRTGLYNTRPPELEMFDERTERLLQQAEESDNLELQEKADAIRIKVESAWNDQRDRELASADQIAVDRYGAAIVLARRYNLSTPAVVRAISRLAFLTSAIGEDKLAHYASRVNGLDYSPGMFLRLRPGMVESPEPQLLPEPAPGIGGTQ